MTITKIEDLKEGMIINGDQRITNVGELRISHRLISKDSRSDIYRKFVWTTSKKEFQQMLDNKNYIVTTK